MAFWETGVGLWSMAHSVYNSGRSRGGAWEAWAPLLFLDQTEAAPEGPQNFFWRLPPPPPLSQGLDDRVPPLSELLINLNLNLNLNIVMLAKSFGTSRQL